MWVSFRMASGCRKGSLIHLWLWVRLPHSPVPSRTQVGYFASKPGSLVLSIPSSVSISEMVSRGKLQLNVPFKIPVGMHYARDRVKETGPFRGAWGTDIASILTAVAKQPTKATHRSKGFPWLPVF